MNSEQKRPPQPSFSQMAFTVFKRCVAAFLLVIALYNWAELIGLAGDGTGRFDLVSSNQRIVEVVLAVAYPAAAAGLWFGVGWGLVLWAIGAAVEMSLAGAAAALVSLHILLFGLYGAFWIYLAFIRRR
ncbi:DUF6163 family protein [Martelella soudanensis]|uniref:DUF6163 family protein n=1 Tax=Martelella sp. NC20 TaxID=2740298 RepID=UPI0015DE60A5|nr:DUF6163 family protein [Martelella sp. NC20]